jgi:hypothetical protein
MLPSGFLFEYGSLLQHQTQPCQSLRHLNGKSSFTGVFLQCPCTTLPSPITHLFLLTKRDSLLGHPLNTPVPLLQTVASLAVMMGPREFVDA